MNQRSTMSKLVLWKTNKTDKTGEIDQENSKTMSIRNHESVITADIVAFSKDNEDIMNK